MTYFNPPPLIAPLHALQLQPGLPWRGHRSRPVTRRRVSEGAGEPSRTESEILNAEGHPTTDTQKPTVVVAGASGFIGQALGPTLTRRFCTIGLSRAERALGGGYALCRQVDLFSYTAARRALEGADYAVYLVHSMLPAARLVQGHFRDLDLLCADNFARACAAAGVRHIVYVGGLVPEEGTLSEHLESRREIEDALGATGIPVTTLRAGMVVGPNGSSYQLLARLVRRLPAMVCPRWTRSRMQPVALVDVVEAVAQVLHDPPSEGRVFDLGSPEALSYQELMGLTARSFGLKRRFFSVPFLSPGLSRLWVTLTTGAPKALVAPLVESLRHDMLVRPEARLTLTRPFTSVKAMLEEAASGGKQQAIVPRAFRKATRASGPSTVCSVQRMSVRATQDAQWTASEYFRWLPEALKGAIAVVHDSEGREVSFHFSWTGHKLLGLRWIESRNDPNRVVLRVTPGLLARASDRARLEFRQVLDSATLVAALHDFVPRLPWWLYRATQGVFHRWVMKRFKGHVEAYALERLPQAQ